MVSDNDYSEVPLKKVEEGVVNDKDKVGGEKSELFIWLEFGKNAGGDDGFGEEGEYAEDYFG